MNNLDVKFRMANQEHDFSLKLELNKPGGGKTLNTRGTISSNSFSLANGEILIVTTVESNDRIKTTLKISKAGKEVVAYAAVTDQSPERKEFTRDIKGATLVLLPVYICNFLAEHLKDLCKLT